MSPEELRLECLKLVQHSANASGMLLEAGQIISRARAYADFVMNWSGRDGANSVNGTPDLAVDLETGSRRHPSPVSQFDTGIGDSGLRGAG